MARKTRKSLEEKMKKVYEAAEKKEKQGLVTTQERLWELNLKNVVYRTSDYFFLADGSYVANCGYDPVSKRNIWMKFDNVPSAVLEALFESAHAEECDNRRHDDYRDSEYDHFLTHDYDEYKNCMNPVERKLVSEDYGNPESIVINRICGGQPHGDDYTPVDFSSLPDSSSIGTNSEGSFDDETRLLMKRIVATYVDGLPVKRKNKFYRYFNSSLMQTEIAEMEGVSKHAISKWKKRFVEEVAEVFKKLGYPVSGAEKIVIETAEQKAYGKADAKGTHNMHCRNVMTELDNLYEREGDEYDSTGRLILA